MSNAIKQAANALAAGIATAAEPFGSLRYVAVRVSSESGEDLLGGLYPAVGTANGGEHELGLAPEVLERVDGLLTHAVEEQRAKLVNSLLAALRQRAWKGEDVLVVATDPDEEDLEHALERASRDR